MYDIAIRCESLTQLLAEVIKKVSEMPASEQNEFASFMLAELESEEHWDALFTSSRELLTADF